MSTHGLGYRCRKVVTLTTWDLMDPDLSERPLEELIKPVHYVSPFQTIDELLPVLRARVAEVMA
mgnify:CR=1 FL=1